MSPLLPKFLQRSFWLSLFLGINLSVPGNAVQLSNGITFFERPPVLDRSSISSRSADVPNVLYQFTIAMPGNAGEPLQKLEFEQVESAETIQFNPSRTEAFLGNKVRSGESTPVTLTPMGDRWILTFDRPIEPGKMVTVALAARRNPSAAGTYFVGVTAFPIGEKPNGQFLGFGRFRIQEGRRNDDR